MFKHVLLPTDGSELSEAGVRKGLQLAKDMQARATVIHVSPPFHVLTYDTDMLEDSRAEYEHHVAERSKRYLERARDMASQLSVPCELVHRVSDRPAESIIEEAGLQDCDLIAMASHGRTGLRGLLIGSETQKVLAHARIPVLVYR